MFQRLLILVVVTLIAVIVIPTAVFADAVVEVDSNGYATGIRGLEVGGITYDVSFPYATFNDLFGSVESPSSPPTFWGDRAGALEASAQMVLALNSSPSAPILGFPRPSGYPFQTAHTPFDTFSPTDARDFPIAFARSADPPTWVLMDQSAVGTWIPTIFAVFSPAVPLPSALPLGIVLMVGLAGATRWRRR